MPEMQSHGSGSHAPLDDPNEMPDCYPIKGNVDSMLYHRPDSENYGATVAEVWFVSPSAAEAAGFSLSSTHPQGSSSAEFELGASGHPCSVQQFDDVRASGAASASARVAAAAEAAENTAGARVQAGSDATEDGGGLGKTAAVAAGGAAAAGAAKLFGSDDDTVRSTAGVADAAGGVAALGDFGDDETAAADRAVEVRETVSMAKVDDADADQTTQMPAAASAPTESNAGQTPFGPGSHAPFADVHEMPECHPIKGNADSMKYHRPDSQGYPKTKAEVWFVSPSVAEAAGFALAGSHPEGSSSAYYEPGASGHPCTADQVNGMGLPGGSAAATGVAAAGAAAAVGSDAFGADETVIMEKPVVPVDDQPFGLGSRAPMADVHEMPECHPIKGNADSMKYHRPDSQGYPNTKAEVWFVSPSVAEAAGFTLAGSHPEGSSSADFEPGASGHPCTAEQLNGLGLGALGFAAAGVGAAASSTSGHDAGNVQANDDETGLGKKAAMAGAGAGVAAVAGAAALLGKDDDKAAAEKAAAEKAAAEKAAAEKAAAAKAEKVAAEKAAAAKAEKAAAEKAAAEKAAAAKADQGVSGKGVAAAGAAGAAALGAAALLGRDGDDDVTEQAGDARETLRTNKADVRETLQDDDTVAGKGLAAAGAVGAAGVAGAAAMSGKGKKVAGSTAAKVGAGATGVAGAAGLAGRGGGGDDDDRGLAAAAGGRFGWLKWLLPLLLIALLAWLLWSCLGGSDGDGAVVDNGAAAVAATVEPTVVPTVAPTAVPTAVPTAEPTPEPTAEPTPEPTAEPEEEPAPAATSVAELSCPSLAMTLADGEFNTLIMVATAADVVGVLSDSGPLTIFAPTDQAFAAVPQAITDALLADTDLLTSVLQYHVVPGAVTSADLAASSVETLNGSSLAVRTDGPAPTINASGITVADLPADQCVVHGVDSVLVPPSLLTTLGIASLNDAVGGQAIQFADGTADFTDADSATLEAICNLVATESTTDGLPPVQWQSSGGTEIDGARAAAIDEALAGCGPGGLGTDVLVATPSFTG